MVTNSLEAAASQVRGTAPPTEEEAAISVTGLVKRYGDHRAVDGIDLEVRRGEIFALLGPNGAGKTTTIEVLEGFSPATSGEVRVLGEDPATASRAWRERLGVVLQDSTTEPELTVRECLELYAGYYEAPREIDEVIGQTGLTELAERPSGKLSGGERRRLDVALALIGDPDLIFLDEPTTGFDPAARRASWEVVEGLRDLGKTIVLTTHYMEEAEELADRIAVIRQGRIVATGTPKTLGARDHAGVSLRFALTADAVSLPADLAGRIEVRDGVAELAVEDLARDLNHLTGWALDHDVALADLEIHRSSLEDVYLELTTEGSIR